MIFKYTLEKLNKIKYLTLIITLLIGKQSSGNENDTIKYDLRRVCPDHKLMLTIDIIQSVATRPDNVVYHALIPKLGDEETLNVTINLQ